MSVLSCGDVSDFLDEYSIFVEYIVIESEGWFNFDVSGLPVECSGFDGDKSELVGFVFLLIGVPVLRES